MRALVFDDLLFLRRDDFSSLEIELRFYAHADDAVAVVAAEGPDLVLMDYSMDARLSGEEAISRLRDRWPPGELRIVGISSDHVSNRRMLAAGADDAIAKPNLRGYLRTIVREGLGAVHRRPARDPADR